VIEDEPSERENEAQRRGRSPHREARQATVCHSQPYTKARFPASRPEQHRHHGEQYCPRRPVELEPQPWCKSRAEATNVRVEPARVRPIEEQVVFDPEPGGEGDDSVGEECNEVADVFLIHNRVHHEDEQCEKQVVDELKPEEDLEVAPDLEIEITHANLNEHSSRRQECHPYSEYETESQKLAKKEDPFRHRRCVGNLTQAGVPFPPDQLAGIENDE